MQRYFLQPQDVVDGVVRIAGTDYHHLARVMRMRPGDHVEVVLGAQVFQARLVSLNAAAACADLALIDSVARGRESRGSLTLLQALPKGDKIDQIIRQACEIGVTRIIVFAALRSVATLATDKQAAKLARWQKIAKEACEQAHRDVLVEIEVAQSATAAIDAFYAVPSPTAADCALLIPYESQSRPLPGLRAALAGRADAVTGALPAVIGIVIGPEGGFAETEIAKMEEAGGVAVSLGPRILRTETAGLAVAAVVMYEWGEWVAPASKSTEAE